MKTRIFMYLFIFSVLLIIFQYVNSKNILDNYEVRLEKKESKMEKYADTINNLQDRVLTLAEFSINDSEQAMSYFEERGYSVSELIPFITDELYELNMLKGEEHPLIPYASMTGGKMLINSVRVLNHKWIIANFSDGKYWGELLLKYELTDDEQLKFNLVESFLYPIN